MAKDPDQEYIYILYRVGYAYTLWRRKRFLRKYICTYILDQRSVSDPIKYIYLDTP